MLIFAAAKGVAQSYSACSVALRQHGAAGPGRIGSQFMRFGEVGLQMSFFLSQPARRVAE